ncbi:hypothetical protein G7046_g10035 [Stylonectria norvegica]|nr:hypothetical protein G7046_g10035 [Stylonectria norvegica]
MFACRSPESADSSALHHRVSQDAVDKAAVAKPSRAGHRRLSSVGAATVARPGVFRHRYITTPRRLSGATATNTSINCGNQDSWPPARGLSAASAASEALLPSQSHIRYGWSTVYCTDQHGWAGTCKLVGKRTFGPPQCLPSRSPSGAVIVGMPPDDV